MRELYRITVREDKRREVRIAPADFDVGRPSETVLTVLPGNDYLPALRSMVEMIERQRAAIDARDAAAAPETPVVPCPKCGGAAIDMRVPDRLAIDLRGRCLYRRDSDWSCATIGASLHSVGGFKDPGVVEVPIGPTEIIELHRPGDPLPLPLRVVGEATTIRFPGSPIPCVVDVIHMPNGTVDSTCGLCGMSFAWESQSEAEFWASSHDGLHRVHVYPTVTASIVAGGGIGHVGPGKPDPSIREVVERNTPIARADLEDQPAHALAAALRRRLEQPLSADAGLPISEMLQTLFYVTGDRIAAGAAVAVDDRGFLSPAPSNADPMFVADDAVDDATIVAVHKGRMRRAARDEVLALVMRPGDDREDDE